MKATLIITDDSGKKFTVVDKTLTPKVNGRGNVSLMTTGFGVPLDGVRFEGSVIYLGLNLGTRRSGTSALVD